MDIKKQKTALVTGAAGFIGFHVCEVLLQDGWRVIGVDCMSDYYDITLKQSREQILSQYVNYLSVHEKIETACLLKQIFEDEKPNVVIHLAAQAGVRYSLENPRAYLESNIVGTFELLEAARAYPPDHMLFASTSSAYGANEDMPFKETDKADHQMSFYAATKKSTENMAHSYSHLFKLPITMFRFFTVYGPWGRPDMALFKFTDAILDGRSFDVYNYGEMNRDFTYITDLVHGIKLLIAAVPGLTNINNKYQDSLSPVAPFRVVNIGNSQPTALIEFIKCIEDACESEAKMNMLPMQPGDVKETYANTDLLWQLTNFRPSTPVKEGVKKFVDWFVEYYRENKTLRGR